MSEFQCYHLNGERKGEIESSDMPFRPGFHSLTTVITSRSERDALGRGHYYYQIHSGNETYCVASTFNHIESELMALNEAKQGGLKPYPKN